MTLDYLAGFIDGEGCIWVSKRSSYRGKVYYFANCQVTNTNFVVLDQIKEAFGGRLTVARKYKANRKPFKTLTFNQPWLKEYGAILGTRLIVKQQQLTNALRFIAGELTGPEASSISKELNHRGEINR